MTKPVDRFEMRRKAHNAALSALDEESSDFDRLDSALVALTRWAEAGAGAGNLSDVDQISDLIDHLLSAHFEQLAQQPDYVEAYQ